MDSRFFRLLKKFARKLAAALLEVKFFRIIVFFLLIFFLLQFIIS